MTSALFEADTTPQTIERAQLPKAEWEFIGPEEATAYLEFNEGNRQLRPDTVKTYVRDLQKGRWLITGDAIRIDTTGKLIDGQHRLKAISEAGIGAWFLVVRNVDPHVQSVLDTQARRNATDALRFAGVRQNARVISAIARSAVAYKRFLDNEECSTGFKLEVISNMEIEEWVKDHPEVHEAAVMAVRLNKSAGNGVTAWGMCYMKFMAIAPAEGREFFNSLADFQTRGKGDPRHTLLTYQPSVTRGRGALGEMLIAISTSWNYFREGKDLDYIKTKVNGRYRSIPVAI